MQGLIHTRLPFGISVIMWMWTMPVCTNYIIFATKINLSRLIELCHHKYLLVISIIFFILISVTTFYNN